MHRRVPVPGLLVIVLLLNVLAVNTAAAHLPSNHPFYLRWSHTDEPVAAGMVDRTWMWGPPGMTEEYGGRQREVQYFDKTRMEINDAEADPPLQIDESIATTVAHDGAIYQLMTYADQIDVLRLNVEPTG
jgi:hypothetical protein